MAEKAFQCVNARRNKILRSLPEIDWERLQRRLERVELELGQVISESGSPMHHVYFPTSSTISLMYVTLDGASTEIAAVGSEGLFGIAVYLGGGTMLSRAVVQSPGVAYRLTRECLRKEFERDGAMKRLLLLYTQARMTLVSQTAVCNRHHSVAQRLSRWLLSNLDRSNDAELYVTHDLISKALGVRREGVTEAAGQLQRSGIIAPSRGRMTVVSRRRLENCSCECYDVVRREYIRLLGDLTHSPAALSGHSTAHLAYEASRVARLVRLPHRTLRSAIDARHAPALTN
jgi:CRP-like cAMP-binding protein